MCIISFLLIVLFFLGLWRWWDLSTRHPEAFPPGPRWTLPFFGNCFELGSDIIKGCERLHDTYGPVVGFFLGPLRTVVISDFDLMKTVLSQDDCADRPHFNTVALLRGGVTQVGGTTPGLIFGNGATWVDQRRFSLHALKNLGFGKSAMEETIEQEVGELCCFLEQDKLKAIDVRHKYNIAVLNTLWRIVSSERMMYTDKRLNAMLARLDAFFKNAGSPIGYIMNNSPLLMNIFKHLNVFDAVQCCEDMFKFCQDSIRSHEQTFQEDSVSRDFIDSYLKRKLVDASNPESTFHGSDGELQLKNVLFDLLMAGSETTSTTLNWATLYMVKNPEVQTRVQAELDSVTGSSRSPSWSDRTDTPYTEAVIHEIQRQGDILPLSVMHSSTKDIHIGGFYIPKGTQVLANIGAVMKDPGAFPEPGAFRPERFLLDGKFVPNPKVVPYGIGKRRCLGESLAKMELYKFFTGILHRFKIRNVPGQFVSEDHVPGTTHTPRPYLVSFEPRL